MQSAPLRMHPRGRRRSMQSPPLRANSSPDGAAAARPLTMCSKARHDSSCPDAAAARQQLARERAHLLEFCAVLAISGNSGVQSEVLLTSVSDLTSPWLAMPCHISGR